MLTIWLREENQPPRRATPTEVPACLSREGCVLWVDVTSPVASDFAWLSETFQFHPLAIEDAQAPALSPKLDEYRGYLFVLAHGVHHDATPTAYRPIHASFFLGERYLVSVYPADVSEINSHPEKVQALLSIGPARLMLFLLSYFVEAFAPFIQRFTEEVNRAEDQLDTGEEKLLDDILSFKRTLAHLRQTASHQRDLLSRLSHHKNPALQEERFLVSDIYDRIVLLLDDVNAIREIVASILEAHEALYFHRSNAVMKLLTLVSTIFFPLTFIASLYGMNFDTSASPWNMPELLWYYGYPSAFGAMLVVVGVMLYFFRRRGWI